jgi:hypothetical protein
MTWTTGTQTEALAANVAVGSAFNTFTAAQYVGATSAAAYLPSNLASLSRGAGTSFLYKAYGIISTTGTPNVTFAISANTTQGTYNSGGVLATTPATATGSGLANVVFDLECLITIVSTGGSGTWLSFGKVVLYEAATTPRMLRLSSSVANPNTAVTLSTESAYYLELAATWSASSASNNIQLYQAAVLGS